MSLDTLGDVLTFGLLLFGIFYVPYKIGRAWWPEIKRGLQWVRNVMSVRTLEDADSYSASQHLPATPPIGGQRMAITGNPVNDPLPGNALPEEIREVIRFWANVEAVEAVVKTGKMGQVEAIETIFRCKRSGRPDSPYARAHAAVIARLAPARYRQYTDEERAILQPNGHE